MSNIWYCFCYSHNSWGIRAKKRQWLLSLLPLLSHWKNFCFPSLWLEGMLVWKTYVQREEPPRGEQIPPVTRASAHLWSVSLLVSRSASLHENQVFPRDFWLTRSPPLHEPVLCKKLNLHLCLCFRFSSSGTTSTTKFCIHQSSTREGEPIEYTPIVYIRDLWQEIGIHRSEGWLSKCEAQNTGSLEGEDVNMLERHSTAWSSLSTGSQDGTTQGNGGATADSVTIWSPAQGRSKPSSKGLLTD